MNQILLVSPPFITAFTGLGILLAEILEAQKKQSLSYISSGSALIIVGVLSCVLLVYSSDVIPDSRITIINFFILDKLTYILWGVVSIFGGLSIFITGEHLQREGKERGELYPIMIFTTFAAMLFVASNSLILLYLSLEMMALGIYILVVFRKDDPLGVEGGTKYYLLGSFASAILLLGIAFLYGATGKTSILLIAKTLKSVTSILSHPLHYIAMVLILVGLLFKLAAIPFHFWAPDAYQGAPLGITSYMAVVLKSAYFGVTIRLLNSVFGDLYLSFPPLGWGGVIWVISVVTMTGGNLLALKQNELKRLLAFSSIAHVGYIFIGILSALKLGQEGEGSIGAVLFYLIAYGFSNLLAFGVLSTLTDPLGEHTTLEEIKGIGKRSPILAFLMGLSMFSLIGIPGSSGFMAKFYIFKWALEADLVYIVIIALINTIISAYYYLKVIVYLYMKEGEETIDESSLHIHVGALTGFTLFISATFILYLGLFPNFLFELFK